MPFVFIKTTSFFPGLTNAILALLTSICNASEKMIFLPCHFDHISHRICSLLAPSFMLYQTKSTFIFPALPCLSLSCQLSFCTVKQAVASLQPVTSAFSSHLLQKHKSSFNVSSSVLHVRKQLALNISKVTYYSPPSALPTKISLLLQLGNDQPWTAVC